MKGKKNLGVIRKKNTTLIETLLLKNCGKLPNLSPKIGGVYTKKMAIEKHKFATNKEA